MTVWDEFCGDIKAGKEVARYQGTTQEESAYKDATHEIDLTDSNANLVSFGWSHIASDSEQIKRAMFDVVGYALAQVNAETDAEQKQKKMKNLCANVSKAQDLLNTVNKPTEAGMAQEMLQGLQVLQQGAEQGKSNTDEGDIEFEPNDDEPQTDTKTAQGRQSENHTEEVSPLQENLAKFKRLAESFLMLVSQLFGVSQPGQNQTNSEDQVELESQRQQASVTEENQQGTLQGQNTQQGGEQQSSPQTTVIVSQPEVAETLSAVASVVSPVAPVVGSVIGTGVEVLSQIINSKNKSK